MARSYAGTLIQPGITTREIDHEVEKFIKKHGGYPLSPVRLQGRLLYLCE